jgi:hypothetical protein
VVIVLESAIGLFGLELVADEVQELEPVVLVVER